MNYLLQVLGNISLSSVIVIIAAVIFVLEVFKKIYLEITKIHDVFQEREQAIENLNKELKNIQDGQIKIYEHLAKMEEKQQEMRERQDSFEKQTRAHNLNKLQDRLLQSHRYYTDANRNPMKAWSNMERDAFFDLFKDYEELGGDSFMHEKVQPEMKLLEVIDFKDIERFESLMQSRKG